MKIIYLLLLLVLTTSCGKSSKKRSIAPEVNAPSFTADELINRLTYPSQNQIQFENEIIADLSQTDPVVSSFGEVLRGRTLNVVRIERRDFLIYGEDGVFATECEPNSSQPTHGPSHPLCQVAHAESFDRIIICTSTDSETPILTAQNWPGYPAALDPTLGLQCWENGVKMLSSRIFTY